MKHTSNIFKSTILALGFAVIAAACQKEQLLPVNSDTISADLVAPEQLADEMGAQMTNFTMVEASETNAIALENDGIPTAFEDNSFAEENPAVGGQGGTNGGQKKGDCREDLKLSKD